MKRKLCFFVNTVFHINNLKAFKVGSVESYNVYIVLLFSSSNRTI